MSVREPAKAGFSWVQTTEIAGYWSLAIADNVELCLEPTVFGHWLLAVYVDGQLAQPEKLDLATAVIAGGPLLELDDFIPPEEREEGDPVDEEVAR
jgi:hypothetical protein